MEQFMKSSTANKLESNNVNEESVQQNVLNSIVSEPKLAVHMENVFFEYNQNKIINDLNIEIPEGKSFTYN